MAKLRHIAVHTPDPEKTAEFYKRVFDMVEVGRTDSPIAKGVYLSDGTINMAVLRQMTQDFREPVIWVLLAIVARGVTEIVAFVLLDQDLIKHGQAEAGVEDELSVIYGRLGQQVPAPDQGRVKGPDNYLGRILAAIFSLGIYMFWWFYNQMEEPNKHFASNGGQEEELVNAVEAVS